MELKQQFNTTVSSGGMGEFDFGINANNLGLVFDIIRNKMYKNPIAAICREIPSNARDANRENGKGNIPINIDLVDSSWDNGGSLSLNISDCGIGISPDRMQNVYCQYGSSTKRNDNTQTGGFGLGAKTPFAYSDTFTIHTIHNGIEYQYSAYIDESGVGKVLLLMELPTTKQSGTKICIPIKKKDKEAFVNQIVSTVFYWTIPPIVTGFHLGKNASTLVKKPLSNDCYLIDYQKCNYVVLVDEIPYNLDGQTVDGLLSGFANPINQNHTCVLKFNVGDLTISATRENLQYDPNTISKLNAKLKLIVATYIDENSTQIQTIQNFWEANQLFAKTIMSHQALINYDWLTRSGSAINLIHTISGLKFFPKLTTTGYSIRKLDPNGSSDNFFNDIDLRQHNFDHVVVAHTISQVTSNPAKMEYLNNLQGGVIVLVKQGGMTVQQQLLRQQLTYETSLQQTLTQCEGLQFHDLSNIKMPKGTVVKKTTTELPNRFIDSKMQSLHDFTYRLFYSEKLDSKTIEMDKESGLLFNGLGFEIESVLIIKTESLTSFRVKESYANFAAIVIAHLYGMNTIIVGKKHYDKIVVNYTSVDDIVQVFNADPKMMDAMSVFFDQKCSEFPYNWRNLYDKLKKVIDNDPILKDHDLMKFLSEGSKGRSLESYSTILNSGLTDLKIKLNSKSTNQYLKTIKKNIALCMILDRADYGYTIQEVCTAIKQVL